MRRLPTLVAGTAVIVAAAGCSAQPGELTASAERVLVPKVQQVREAAAHGSYPHLVSVVNQLKALVASERSAGEVSDSRANDIIDAADTLLTDARPTPSSTPTQSSSPTPTQSQSASPTPSQSQSPSPTPSSSSGSPSPGTTITIGIGPH